MHGHGHGQIHTSTIRAHCTTIWPMIIAGWIEKFPQEFRLRILFPIKRYGLSIYNIIHCCSMFSSSSKIKSKRTFNCWLKAQILNEQIRLIWDRSLFNESTWNIHKLKMNMIIAAQHCVSNEVYNCSMDDFLRFHFAIWCFLVWPKLSYIFLKFQSFENPWKQFNHVTLFKCISKLESKQFYNIISEAFERALNPFHRCSMDNVLSIGHWKKRKSFWVTSQLV